MVEPEQTRLTATQIERLTPLLHDLVNTVSRVGVPDERALGALLGNAGLIGEAWAAGELRLWAQLLARARGTRDEAQAITIRRALTDRGVREAPAMLAVDMLASDQRADPPTVSPWPDSSTTSERATSPTLSDRAWQTGPGATHHLEAPTRPTVVPRPPAPTPPPMPAAPASPPPPWTPPPTPSWTPPSPPPWTPSPPPPWTPSPPPPWPPGGGGYGSPGPTTPFSNGPSSTGPFGVPPPNLIATYGQGRGSSPSRAGIVLGLAVFLAVFGLVAVGAALFLQSGPTLTASNPTPSAPVTAAPVAAQPNNPSTSPPGAPASAPAPAPAQAPPKPDTAPSQTPADRLREAEAALNGNDFPRALSILTQLAQTDPATPGLDDLLYRTRLRYAQALLERGDHDGSYAQYDAILKNRPDDQAARDGQRQVLLVKNWDRQEANWDSNPDEAIRALEDIMILDPNYRDARKKLYAQLLGKADRQAKVGEREGELASLRRAHDVYPEGPEAIARLNPPQPAQAPQAPSAPLAPSVAQPSGPAAVGEPTLRGSSFSPRTVSPGGMLTLNYDIENPNAFAMIVVLGASIRPGGGSWIDDASNDARVTVPPGRGTYSRAFRVPSGAPGGTYEVWHSLLDDALKHSYGKLIQSGLTVNGVQASAPVSGPSPDDAVRRHYVALGNHDFQTAWNLLSPRVQANNNFNTWAGGYASTASVQVSTGAVSQSGGSATVAVSLVAVDRQGGSTVTKRFEGTWDLVLVNGEWRLDRPSIRQVG